MSIVEKNSFRPRTDDYQTSRVGEWACRVEQAVRIALNGSVYLPIRQVSCRVRLKTLVLRGVVPSYYLKQIAQERVRELLVSQKAPEDLVIDNQIEIAGKVEPPTGTDSTN
jgi:hypothetical protein